MEAFKIEHYEREHGSGTFVPFRTLSLEEANHIFGLMKQRLKLSSELDGLQVVRIIDEKSAALAGVDATRDDFDLGSVLRQLRYEDTNTVFLNWYRFDKMDEFRTKDVCKIFSDIFYPSSDDLYIVDPDLNWLLSIAHHGTVSAFRFP